MPLFNSNDNNNLIPNKNKNIRLRLRTEIKRDKKIISLFNNPIELKEIKLRQKNTYKFNIINPAFGTSVCLGLGLGLGDGDKKLKKIINLNEFLSIFLRGINIYNLILNNYLKKNNTKLKLIRELKYDDYKKFNIIYNNYLYLLNRYLPLLRIRSLIYKLELFAPNRILKYNYLYTNIYLKTKKNILHLNKNFESLKNISFPLLPAEGEQPDPIDTMGYPVFFTTSLLLRTSGGPLRRRREFIKNNINYKNINRMEKKILEKGLILSLELNKLINKNKIIFKNFK